MSLNFQVEGTISAAESSVFSMEESRYYFLEVLITITVTGVPSAVVLCEGAACLERDLHCMKKLEANV